MAAAGGQVHHRRLGAGEVDQHLRALQAGVQVGRDGHAAGPAGKAAGILAQRGAAFAVQRAGQGAVAGGAHGLDQHLAHAAGGAGNGNAQR